MRRFPPFTLGLRPRLYIEILHTQSGDNGEDEENKKSTPKRNFDNITPKVIKLIASTIDDLADDDGWAFLGDVGNLLQKKQPNFDSRNYGFQKLTPMINSINRFEIEQREGSKGKFKLIYVRNKE